MSDLEAYRAVEQFAVFDVLGVRTHWSVMIGHEEIWGLDFWLSKRNYFKTPLWALGNCDQLFSQSFDGL